MRSVVTQHLAGVGAETCGDGVVLGPRAIPEAKVGEVSDILQEGAFKSRGLRTRDPDPDMYSMSTAVMQNFRTD